MKKLKVFSILTVCLALGLALGSCKNPTGDELIIGYELQRRNTEKTMVICEFTALSEVFCVENQYRGNGM